MKANADVSTSTPTNIVLDGVLEDLLAIRRKKLVRSALLSMSDSLLLVHPFETVEAIVDSGLQWKDRQSTELIHFLHDFIQRQIGNV